MASSASDPNDIPGWVALCGNLAPPTAIIVCLAPLPTIRKIEHDKAVGSLPLLPYSCMISNAFLWTIYGILRDEPRVWITNVIGLVFSLYYFVNFIKYAPSKSSTLPGSIQQHKYACYGVVVGTLAITYMSPLMDPAKIIGNAAVMFCVAMFGSPLAALKTVLETKSATSIPLPFTIATIFNCFFWSVAGLLDMKDANIYFPNLLGLMFGCAQLFLKILYGDGSKLRNETKLELVM